jgi:hypothetical protein
METVMKRPVFSSSYLAHLALCLFGQNTVTNIVKTSLSKLSASNPICATLGRYIETLVRERHKMICIAFS